MNPAPALEGLYTYFDNLAEGITILDLDGRIVSMNRTTARILGIGDTLRPQGRIEDLSDAFTPAGDLIPGKDRPAVLARSGRFVRNFEALLRPRGGLTSTWVEISTAPILDEEGKTTRIILSYRDISDRRRIDEVRARHAAIVESSEDAIVGLDNQGIVTTWNMGAEKIFGYTAAEMIGASITRIIAEHRKGEEETILRRVRSGEVLHHFETVRRRKDGILIEVSLTVSPVRNAAGEIIGVSKIARDITGSRRAQDALHESQQRLTGIIDSAMDAIITIDAGQHIVLFNAAAEKMFLCPQSAAIGALIERFIPERHRAFHGRHIRKFGETGTTGRAMGELGTLWALRANGEEFPIEASISQIEAGGAKLYTVILRDITERRQAAESLRQQAELLRVSQMIARDMDDRIVFWPEGAQKMYGFTPEEALGAMSHRLFHTEFPEPVENIKEHVLKTGRWEGELIHRTRDDQRLVVSTAWILHCDKDGKPARILESLINITESKRTQDALHESQQRLTGIIDSAMDAIITIDAGQHIVLFNAAAERMFLCPQSAAIGAPIERFIPERHRAFHGQHIRKFGETGTTGRAMGELGTLWALRADGEEFPIEASISQIEAGGVKLYTVILRDITERRQAAESLRRQAEEISRSRQSLEENSLMLQSVLDSMTEGLVAADETGKFILWNPAAEKIIGLGPDDIVSSQWNRHYGVFRQDAVTPLPPEENPLTLAIAGEANSAVIFVRNEKVPDGRYMDIYASPLRDRNGATRGGVTAFRDITERRRAEEQVRQSEERFAHIFRSSPIAITITIAAEGRYVDVNAAFLELLGYEAAQVIGRTDAELGIWAQPEQRAAATERLARDGKLRSFEAQYSTHSGRRRAVILSMDAVTLDGVACILTNGLDVTETRMLEQQFRQSQKMEALGQLTGGIAHDFNNLLGVIVGNLDLLERMVAGMGDGNGVPLKRVQTAQRATARGAELTRRLLAFSRSEQLNPAPVQVEAALRDLVEMATRTLGPEIRIAMQCDPDMPPIYADGAALETALLNLAVNARDAMPKGGSLTLTAHLADLNESYALVQAGELKPGRYARISVSDSGCGMSRETLDRAIEPFFTTKQRDKGTGLGLAMVYGFIKQSDGAIRLYSELGVGTTVSLFLPLSVQPAEEIPQASTALPAENPGGAALVVDDELDLLDIAEAFLTELGYTVIRAADGPSALRAVEEAGHLDLMVTDIIMPGSMNGVELARKVRELRPGIKIIYTSGFPAEALAERSGKLDGGPLLHKPYQRTEFADMVRRSRTAAL